jgi:hypothetical protein
LQRVAEGRQRSKIGGTHGALELWTRVP